MLKLFTFTSTMCHLSVKNILPAPQRVSELPREGHVEFMELDNVLLEETSEKGTVVVI